MPQSSRKNIYRADVSVSTAAYTNKSEAPDELFSRLRPKTGDLLASVPRLFGTAQAIFPAEKKWPLTLSKERAHAKRGRPGASSTCEGAIKVRTLLTSKADDRR